MNTVPFEPNHTQQNLQPCSLSEGVFTELSIKVNIKPMNMVKNHRQKPTVSLASLNEVRGAKLTVGFRQWVINV